VVIDDVEQRAKLFLSQGLTPDDCLWLVVERGYTDWANLLAACSIGCVVLLVSERALVRPGWVTVELTHRQAGRLNRVAETSFKHATSEDPLIGIFSSGSTGEPKAIWHRLSHFLASASGSNALMPLISDDVSLVSLPLYHVGGLGTLFRSALSRSHLVFGPKADDLTALLQGRVSRLSLVPTQLYRLLQQGAPPERCSVLLGGAPITDTLFSKAMEAGWRLHRSYGLSEMASQVITEVNEDRWEVLPHARVRSQSAELVVAGKSLFLGYGSPAVVQDNKRPAEFLTRDIAQLNLPHFKFVGRKDNLFICGGENVQPEAVEAQFLQAFRFSEVYLVPKPDPEWGARPVLLITKEDRPKVEHIKDYARRKLLPHQQPAEYYFLPEKRGLKYSRQQLTKQVTDGDLETIN
jgi:O-succinylbenzoic acid--CoA ligase